ncbi:hypothetical protein ACQ4LE_008486 [Meloidogyne hapla]
MPEILNIPVAESKNSRYKPSHLTRVASIVICFLLVALVSTFTVRYFTVVTTIPLPTQIKRAVDQQRSRVSSISERMDALHSKVTELQRAVDVISRKNSFSLDEQKSKTLFPNEFKPKEFLSKQSSLQQHQQLLEQHPRMWSRPVMRLVPQGQMESQLHSFEKEKRMVSWQPVKREDLLLWTEEEIGERKIYDAIARERGEFACEFKKLEADVILKIGIHCFIFVFYVWFSNINYRATTFCRASCWQTPRYLARSNSRTFKDPKWRRLKKNVDDKVLNFYLIIFRSLN